MRIAGILIICLFCLALMAGPALSASLTPMDDAELDHVRGQSGIAVAIDDLKVYFFDAGVAIEDTTTDTPTINNQIGLFDKMVSINRFHTNTGVTLRVYENQWDYAMIALEALRFEGLDMPALEVNIGVDVMDFSFYDAALDTESDLGSLHVAGFSPSEFALYVAPLGAMQPPDTLDATGVGFQLETRLEIEEFRWVYNKDEDELRFAGIHLTGSFDPAGDYTDPTTWTPDGRFSIGRMDPRDEVLDPSFTPAPATFFVMRDEPYSDNGAKLVILLPDTRGSMRIAETELGGKNFGPVIVDGFRAHHLQVDLVPW